jgi:intracellular sulfur oxidation DsrE/DsrF family protein
MNRIIRVIAVGLLLATTLPAGADPGAMPTAQAAKPMRVVVQVSESDPKVWNLALNNARNAQKDVGAANIEIEVVAFGPGLGMLRDDSLVANRVDEALAAGVRFVACRNTMQAQHVTEAEMIPGIGYAQAGVVEIIKKQMEGFAYLRP